MKNDDKFLEYMYEQVREACIERDQRDRITRVNQAYREGIAEGEMRKAKAVAMRMFEMGMPLEEISKMTAFSPEATQALLRQ